MRSLIDILRWFGYIARRLIQRLRADHRTITTRQIKMMPAAMNRHYLYVAVAPSRWAARRPDDEAVRRAHSFANRAFPNLFPAAPTFSNADVVIFAQDGQSDSAWERRLLIHRSGLVELLWAVELVASQQGTAWGLPALDMLRPVRALAAAVATDDYARLSTLHRPWRGLAKLDWWLAMTNDVNTPSGPRSWTAVRFPGTSPPRSSHDRGYMPPIGYGGEALRSTSRRLAATRVPEVLLVELLRANGYYEIGSAVAETLDALQAQPIASEPADVST